MDKKVLLIGGGGTIGTYVARELLEKGCLVDIICLEDYVSDNDKLRYIKANVNYDYLNGFLTDKYYNGILDFIHQRIPEDYIRLHMLYSEHSDHEIFFSSIRAVSDTGLPITEENPLMIDRIEDPEYVKEHFNHEIGRNFIQKDAYSLSKGRCERYLKYVSKSRKWTIVRPMINSSDKRLDLILNTFHKVIEYAKADKIMYLPAICRDKVAGLEWAGNTGKMIANLMFKEECMGEVYMLSTGHNMTWEDVANVYTELLGLKVEWLSDEAYKALAGWGDSLVYDRNYNRFCDNSKILRDTGLKTEDFTPFKEGIKQELIKLGAI